MPELMLGGQTWSPERWWQAGMTAVSDSVSDSCQWHCNWHCHWQLSQKWKTKAGVRAGRGGSCWINTGFLSLGEARVEVATDQGSIAVIAGLQPSVLVWQNIKKHLYKKDNYPPPKKKIIVFPESYMLVGNFRKLLEIHFNDKHRVGQTPADNGQTLT